MAWSLAVAIVVLSLIPRTLRPETDLPHDVEHFGIFWLTGLAFAVAYDRRRVLLAALLVLFSGAVEICQLLVPGRHARLSDFIVDALAVLVGAMIPQLVEWIAPSP